MTEEEVSVEFFLAATSDSDVDVLCWQSVDGKNYFAFDIKLRLSTNERVEPDLILRTARAVWLIEVKGTHAEALDDEMKLVSLVEDLGEEEILAQIYRRAGVTDVEPRPLLLAVAYGDGGRELDAACESLVHHLCWPEVQQRLESVGLAAVLDEISGAAGAS